MSKDFPKRTDTVAKELFGLADDADGTLRLMKEEVVTFCIQHFPADSKLFQSSKRVVKDLVWKVMVDIREKYADCLWNLEDHLLEDYQISDRGRAKEYFVSWAVAAAVTSKPSTRLPLKRPKNEDADSSDKDDEDNPRKSTKVLTGSLPVRSSLSPLPISRQLSPDHTFPEPRASKLDWSKVVLRFTEVDANLPDIRVPLRVLLHDSQNPHRGVHPEELTIGIIDKWFSKMPSHQNARMRSCHIRRGGSTEPPGEANDGELGVILMEWEEVFKAQYGIAVMVIEFWMDFEASSLTSTPRNRGTGKIEEHHKNL